MAQIQYVRTSLIIPNPKNKRRSLSDSEDADNKLYQTIDGLAQNIHEVGLINPLTVTHFGNDYMIIAGERRYKACVQLGWDEIPCMVMESTDAEQSDIRVSENMQRKDLTEIEKADDLRENQVTCDRSGRQLAKKFGLTLSYVQHLLNLAGYPEEIKTMVKYGEVASESVRPLSQITKDDYQKPLQVKTAEHIRDNRMTYSEAKVTVDAVNSLPPEVRSTLADNPEVTVSDVITPEICGDEEEESTEIVNDFDTFLTVGKQLYSMLDKGNVKTHFNAYNRIVMKKYLLSLKERINGLLDEIDYI